MFLPPVLTRTPLFYTLLDTSNLVQNICALSATHSTPIAEHDGACSGEMGSSHLHSYPPSGGGGFFTHTARYTAERRLLHMTSCFSQVYLQVNRTRLSQICVASTEQYHLPRNNRQKDQLINLHDVCEGDCVQHKVARPGCGDEPQRTENQKNHGDENLYDTQDVGPDDAFHRHPCQTKPLQPVIDTHVPRRTITSVVYSKHEIQTASHSSHAP